ncbi:MAG: cbb3-type cytochrome c oxidase subunit I, partial [Candidatus Puniceispirillum sp.]
MGKSLSNLLLAAAIAISGWCVFMAEDLAYQTAMGVLFIAAVFTLLRAVLPGRQAVPADPSHYMDDVVRAGVIATAFWGLVGFAAGVYIAFQLAFPELNFDLPYTTFGRLRPLHTSAVIFAFGGNALICTSFYVVQRTSAARLWGGNLAWFVFWGYQIFIVMAATGYILGATQSKEYAEPEWYTDIWLTIVWVAYLAVFFGTILKRREPHIYVA